MEIKGLYKSFGDLQLFRDFNISFREGEITCILGPSGCGKTTLLNIIGKLITPDSGTFEGFEGKIFSYIFQEPRLLPWKTVKQNIEFVLDRKMSEEERHEVTGRFISLVDLDDFADYYPSKLSGGMRQRVSIARAFAYRSDIILMDEPLKGLDIKLKMNLIQTFARIWQTDRRTVIFVTHDVDEALLLGNRILVFSKPPVEIVTERNIELPFGGRSLNSEYMRTVEKDLLTALEGDE